MEPLDPLDPRIVGWWKITHWDPRNDDTSPDRFPPEAFVRGETHANLLQTKDETFQIVWSNKDGSRGSLDYSRAAITRMSFAGNAFLCGIKPALVLVDHVPPRALRLTVTLTTPVEPKGGTGNTGTFIAQSVPGPPPQGTPGPDKHGS